MQSRASSIAKTPRGCRLLVCHESMSIRSRMALAEALVNPWYSPTQLCHSVRAYVFVAETGD